MDDNNNPDDVRQSLYEEFLSEVVKAGNPEAYFDEADLVEIFDYSSDMDNYIAKMEVLLYGARHYPDSQALATRRAWFYSSFGEMDAAAELNSRVSNGGVLNELLKLRAIGTVDSPEIKEGLDKIVAATTDFADEELIQLVDFCAEAGLLQWVEDNYQLVKSKCSYPQTFIYEYANRCEDLGDTARAVSLFEELTMLEPFTLDFWERLAGAQYRASLFESALSSADYALAIDPSSVEAARVKGMSLYSLKRDMAGIVSIMEPVLLSPMAIDSDLSVYVGAMVETGRPSEATGHIKLYLHTHATTRHALGLMLSIDPAEARPYMDELEKQLMQGGESLLSWAWDVYFEGNIELAARIAAVHIDHNPLSCQDASKVAEIMMRAELFEKAVEVCGSGLHENGPEIFSLPQFVYAYVISLIRLRRLPEALTVAKDALHINLLALHTSGHILMMPVMGLSPVGHNMLTRGFITFLIAVIHDINDPDTEVDPDSYVPGP